MKTSNALRSISSFSDFVSVPGRLRLAISASTLSLTFFSSALKPSILPVIEELQAAITGKMDGGSAELKKFNDKVDAEIAKRNRPGTETKSETAEIERKAFEIFLRKGKEGL